MATDSVRCYLVIDLGASRTGPQITALKQQAVQEPTIGKIVQYGANRDQTHLGFNAHRISITPVNRYIWVELELDIADVDEAQLFIDAQCAARGIVQPTYRLKFQALIQAELREAATLAGGGAFAGSIVVTIVGWGNRDTAIADSLTVMRTNAAVWGEA